MVGSEIEVRFVGGISLNAKAVSTHRIMVGNESLINEPPRTPSCKARLIERFINHWLSIYGMRISI